MNAPRIQSVCLLCVVSLLLLTCKKNSPPEPIDSEHLTRTRAQELIIDEVLGGDLTGIDWGYISAVPLPPNTLLFTQPDSIYTPDFPTWTVILYRDWFESVPEASWILINSLTGEYEILEQQCLCLTDRSSHNRPPAFICFRTPESGRKDCGNEKDTLAIYLTEKNTPEQNNPHLDSLTLMAEPLISSADMSRYIWCTHTIQYPDSVHERMLQYTDLLQRRFILAIDTTRIYWGSWTFYSHSHPGTEPVMIAWPERKGDEFYYVADTSLTIHRSYYDGIWLEKDPRFDDRIFNALRQWNVVQPYECGDE